MHTKSGPAGGATAGGAMRAGFVLAILFFAAFYTYIAFAELNYLSSAGRLGPGFFPRVIGVALVVLCTTSLYVDLKHHTAAESVAPAWRSAAVLALLSGVFIGLLELLGGLASMIAFMAAALWILNPGRALQNALIAVLLPLAIYLVFQFWLKAAMPRGILPLPF